MNYYFHGLVCQNSKINPQTGHYYERKAVYNTLEYYPF